MSIYHVDDAQVYKDGVLFHDVDSEPLGAALLITEQGQRIAALEAQAAQLAASGEKVDTAVCRYIFHRDMRDTTATALAGSTLRQALEAWRTALAAYKAQEGEGAMNTKELAKEIVEYLFKDGAGRKAQRLVMEYKGERKDGTGWSKAAVMDVIEDFLKKLKQGN